MKEVTYEDWQKNPTPRMMWVWDSNVEEKKKERVIAILEQKNIKHKVLAVQGDYEYIKRFKHCAEIEEPETRRMTHKELSRWLRKKPTREFRYRSSCSVYSTHAYDEDDEEAEVPEDILIREDDGEWREPLVEVEE